MFLTTSLHVLPRRACTQRENSRFSTKVKVKVRSVMSDSLWRPGLYSPWKSPGQNTGVGSLSSACNAGDPSSIPGLGRSPGEEKGYPLQYSDLENSKDCIVHGVTKSQRHWATFPFILNTETRELTNKLTSIVSALMKLTRITATK